jgi:hypothetical protein
VAVCTVHSRSIGTELTRDDRKKLYSSFGLLYPHGHNELSIAEDFDQIRAAMEKVPAYANVFNKVCERCHQCAWGGVGATEVDSDMVHGTHMRC